MGKAWRGGKKWTVTLMQDGHGRDTLDCVCAACTCVLQFGYREGGTRE